MLYGGYFGGWKRDNGKENGIYYISYHHREVGNMRVILGGLYRDNGKENGNTISIILGK